MNDEPIAFFLTISTYGTWLPGDARGWTERKRGWQMPDPVHELEAKAKLSEDACILSAEQRKLVEAQLEETCQFRKWVLQAKNCRSNHMHIVVGAYNVAPKKIRIDLKAWCTRRLKESDPTRQNWFTERGSIRWLFDDESLDLVVQYVNEAQDRKHLDFE